MNKKIFGLLVGLFVFSLVSVSAISYDDSDSTESMLVKVDVLQSTVSISVPDNLVIEDIASGYISEMQSFDIINTGTTDIQVVPELDSSTDNAMFSNLGFKRVQADELTKIGFFDVEIEKPATVGSQRSQSVYVQLDLTDYEDDVNVGENNATVIFTAVPL